VFIILPSQQKVGHYLRVESIPQEFRGNFAADSSARAALFVEWSWNRRQTNKAKQQIVESTFHSREWQIFVTPHKNRYLDFASANVTIHSAHWAGETNSLSIQSALSAWCSRKILRHGGTYWILSTKIMSVTYSFYVKCLRELLSAFRY